MVCVSGGFDPLHYGHIQLFKHARALGDNLVVLLNSDDWLKRKKGFVFMPFQERKQIIEACRYVDSVVPVVDKDDTVCRTLSIIEPDIFANGGDRTRSTTTHQEQEVCEALGIDMKWDVSGEETRHVHGVDYIRRLILTYIDGDVSAIWLRGIAGKKWN